ncbi:MAG: hypothetical protein J5574_06330 [Lachnospiraceae bacterium]|nr:hypothetical protein [Lachnospiraceae bacterium]
MHPEDYSQQIAAGWFALTWIVSWLGLATIAGIISLIQKWKNKRGGNHE